MPKRAFFEMRRWARMASRSVSLIWFHSCGDGVVEVGCSGRGVGEVDEVCRGILKFLRRVEGGM